MIRNRVSTLATHRGLNRFINKSGASLVNAALSSCREKPDLGSFCIFLAQLFLPVSLFLTLRQEGFRCLGFLQPLLCRKLQRVLFRRTLVRMRCHNRVLSSARNAKGVTTKGSAMVRFHDFISNQGHQLSDLIGFPRPIRLTIFPNSDTSPGRGVNCRVDSSIIFRPRAPC